MAAEIELTEIDRMKEVVDGSREDLDLTTAEYNKAARAVSDQAAGDTEVQQKIGEVEFNADTTLETVKDADGKEIANQNSLEQITEAILEEPTYKDLSADRKKSIIEKAKRRAAVRALQARMTFDALEEAYPNEPGYPLLRELLKDGDSLERAMRPRDGAIKEDFRFADFSPDAELEVRRLMGKNDDLAEYMRNSEERMKKLENAAENGETPEKRSRARRAWEAIKRSKKWAAGGAALAGASYMLFLRAQSQSRINSTCTVVGDDTDNKEKALNCFDGGDPGEKAFKKFAAACSCDASSDGGSPGPCHDAAYDEKTGTITGDCIFASRHCKLPADESSVQGNSWKRNWTCSTKAYIYQWNPCSIICGAADVVEGIAQSADDVLFGGLDLMKWLASHKNVLVLVFCALVAMWVMSYLN